MSRFVVTKTTVKANDTLEKFEKKVKKASLDATLDAKKVAKYLDELDKKEGVWGVERCCDIRSFLEEDAEYEE